MDASGDNGKKPGGRRQWMFFGVHSLTQRVLS